MLSTVSINEAEFGRLCMGMFGSLCSRGLKVMDARKNGAREGDTRGECLHRAPRSFLHIRELKQ